MLRNVKTRSIKLERTATDNLRVTSRCRTLTRRSIGIARSIVACLATVAVLVALSGCGDGTTITLCNSDCGGSPPPNSTTTNITASPTKATVGDIVTLTATVSPATSGVIDFSDAMAGGLGGGQAYLNSGTATLPLSTLGVGTHVLTATFLLDSPYLASTSVPGVVVTISAAGANCGLNTGVYVLTSGTATQSGGSYSGLLNNQSAVCAANSGTSLTLNNPTISSIGNAGQSGDVSNDDISGMGAAVLAYGASTSSALGASATITGGSITTSGIGADDVFASGLGSAVNLTGTALSTTYFGITNGGGALLSYNHAAAAARGGSVTLNNVSAANTQDSGALFSSDGDGSAVTVNGGNFVANSYTARIEGSGSLTLNNADITGNYEFGIIFINTATDGSGPGSGSFNMTGGSFALPTSLNGVGIAVSNGSVATITLTATSLVLPTGSFPPVLVQAGDYPGGSSATFANLVANATNLPGDFRSDGQSTLNVSLANKAVWSGCFTPDTGIKNLTLDATSTWNVSRNCHVESFIDPAGISGSNVTNVTGNGHTVTYNPAKNPVLGGLTYHLAGGGLLAPGTL